MAAVRERFVSLAREVVGLDTAAAQAANSLLAKQVEWGAFILQIRPKLLGDAVFLKWLEDAKFGHFQKVYAAIGLAQKYATRDGHLDEAKLDRAIDEYNAAAPAKGYMPIKPGSRSVRGAQIAGGMRSGRRIDDGSGAPEPGGVGAGSGAPEPGGLAEVDEATRFIAEMSGIPLRGTQTARSATAAGFAAAGLRAVSSDAPGRPAGAIQGDTRHGVAGHPDDRSGAGDADAGHGPESRATRIEAGRGTGGGKGEGGRRKGEVVGQMTLEEEYAEAADMARVLSRMFDAHAVEPGLMARFVELVREVQARPATEWRAIQIPAAERRATPGQKGGA